MEYQRCKNRRSKKGGKNVESIVSARIEPQKRIVRD